MSLFSAFFVVVVFGNAHTHSHTHTLCNFFFFDQCGSTVVAMLVYLGTCTHVQQKPMVQFPDDWCVEAVTNDALAVVFCTLALV